MADVNTNTATQTQEQGNGTTATPEVEVEDNASPTISEVESRKAAQWAISCSI